MAKKFIQSAIKRPGQLHRDLGVPQGQRIPASKLAAAAKMGGKIGQRARFAQTLKKIRGVGSGSAYEPIASAKARMEHATGKKMG